jgi:hypothetical protein|tara:strand:- start:195 stop:413 length:219 start_codon:yes stop_codon:yes gene_type:complete
MRVGDLVKHNGDDGWWIMKGRIGVLIELVSDNGMVENQKHRWIVQWCSPDMPKYYRELFYWPQHLEVINAVK